MATTGEDGGDCEGRRVEASEVKQQLGMVVVHAWDVGRRIRKMTKKGEKRKENEEIRKKKNRKNWRKILKNARKFSELIRGLRSMPSQEIDQAHVSRLCTHTEKA